MKFSTAAVVASAAVAYAAPMDELHTLEKRKVNDFQVLNYALTLEHLEATFYAEGLSRFSEKDFEKEMHPSPWFYKNIKEVAADEAEHVSFLTSAIKAAGGVPVKACQYDFGVTDVKSFLQTAAILEGVGVTAYLGAAKYIANKDYLTAAGAILTVEARHSAHLRAHTLDAPYPAPFDTPMGFSEVYSLASLFIKSCNGQNPKAPLPTLKKFPALTSSATSAVSPGDTITVTSATALTGDVYYAWFTVLGPVFGKAMGSGKSFKVTVPKTGVNGQSFVVLTKSNKVINDGNVLAGPAITEVTAAYNGLN